MRIRNLSLDRFGHFTGQRFDFGDRAEGSDFHIIYGLNEAGKTTTMEAVLRLLYGFPARDPYDFRHQRKNLQVSAVLELDGGARRFTRLSQRTGNLTDENGIALPEAALGRHLGGLGLEDYRMLLCLDDATIERGGDEIANAKGETGRLLFSAAAGVSDLTTVLDRIRMEADRLYRKRASTSEMAALKRDLATVEKTLRETDLNATGWRRLRHALAEAQSVERGARDRCKRLGTDAAGVRTLQDALPLLAEIDALDARVGPLADYPQRLDLNPEDLVRLLTEQTRATGDRDRLQQEIARVGAERDGLTSRPEALDLAEALDALDTLRGRYTSAVPDLPKRRETLAAATADMALALRDLHVAADTDPAPYVLSSVDLARLEAARDLHRRRHAEQEAEAREDRAAAERLDEAEAETPGTETVETPVADLLDRFDAETLVPAVAAARQALSAAEETLRDALHALGFGGHVFTTPPPGVEPLRQAEERAQRHAETLREIAQARAEADAHDEAAAIRAAEIVALSRETGIVGDAQARAQRAARDGLWQAMRARPDATAADAFEAAMHEADRLADIRLAQARDLARLRETERAKAESDARRAEAGRRLDRLEVQRDQLEDAARQAARVVGLEECGGPGNWHEWVCLHAAALKAEHDHDRLRRTHGDTLDRAEALSDALRPLVPLHAAGFDALLRAALRHAAQERAEAERSRMARKGLDRLRQERLRRKERLDAVRSLAREAETAWTALVRDIFSGTVEPKTLDASLEPLRRLRELEAIRAQAARQVASMEDDQSRFAAELATLARAHGLPPEQPPLVAFAALRTLAEAARAARDKRDALDAALTQMQAQHRAATGRLADIDREIATLGALFPGSIAVSTLPDLRRAVTMAQEAIDLRSRRSACLTNLLAGLGVANLAEARDRLDTHDAASLEARAAAIETERAEAEADLALAMDTRIGAERDLRAITGDADIARLTEDKAVLELQIEETALRHLELSFGHRLAEEAIRRYRDSHRSAMMAATEAAFRDLTAGAYARLRTQVDGASETLLAIDAGGTAKGVQDLSKGTRFQLYLALRAAAYAQMADQGVTLPFFCDDIFETFDEDRTRAACSVMERIGRTGQAIYLTHHRHVVEIALEHCGTAPRIHELPAPR